MTSIKRLGNSVMTRDFDRQVAEIQVRITQILSRCAEIQGVQINIEKGKKRAIRHSVVRVTTKPLQKLRIDLCTGQSHGRVCGFADLSDLKLCQHPSSHLSAA